jgi:hypothetical protein
MPRPVNPRFLTLRLRWGRTPVARAATIVRAGSKIAAMNFMPPQAERERRDAIRDALIASFPPRWQKAISMAGASGDSACFIELRPPVAPEAVVEMARAFAQAFPGRDIIINGACVDLEDIEEIARVPGTPWTPWSWPPGLRPRSWWDTANPWEPHGAVEHPVKGEQEAVDGRSYCRHCGAKRT